MHVCNNRNNIACHSSSSSSNRHRCHNQVRPDVQVNPEILDPEEILGILVRQDNKAYPGVWALQAQLVHQDKRESQVHKVLSDHRVHVGASEPTATLDLRGHPVWLVNPD